MSNIRRLVIILVATIGMAILLAVIIGMLAMGTPSVTMVEHIRWITYVEFVSFCVLAGYSIGLVLRIWRSTGKYGGHCVFCGGQLSRNKEGDSWRGVRVL